MMMTTKTKTTRRSTVISDELTSPWAKLQLCSFAFATALIELLLTPQLYAQYHWLLGLDLRDVRVHIVAPRV